MFHLLMFCHIKMHQSIQREDVLPTAIQMCCKPEQIGLVKGFTTPGKMYELETPKYELWSLGIPVLDDS